MLPGHYNPNIAHVFYLAGFIESWGRGIEKICNACREENVPLPEYTVHPGDIMVKFTVADTMKNISHPQKVTDGVTDKVSEGESSVLALLREDPAYTYQALSEKLGVSRKTVSQRLKSLKEKGILRRIGSDREGHWEILL